MKKILILNYEYPPLGGGQANANLYLLKEFLNYKDNFDIDVITSSIDTYREEQFGTNIKIYFLDIGKKGKNIHSQSIKDLLFNFYKTFFLSKKLLQKKKYDMIICWSYPAIGIGYLLKKIYNIPYISLLRGSETPFYEKKWDKLDKYIFQYLAPIFWKNSKYVIANSQGLKDLALKISPNQKIHIISNGVNLTEFNILKNRNKNVFQILFVGRLTERKGVHHLIKGFQLFAQNKKNVMLNIAGEGQDYDLLTHLVIDLGIEKQVNFLGKIDHKKLPAIYNSNNIYILPSSNEGMSNTLLEALASSLPVIVTDVGGTQELFHNNGWMIKVGDIKDIAEKLELAYKSWDEGTLENLGQKSFEIVSVMSWEEKAKEFIKYL